MPRIKVVLLIMLALLILTLIASVCFGLFGHKRPEQKSGEAPAVAVEQPASNPTPPPPAIGKIISKPGLKANKFSPEEREEMEQLFIPVLKKRVDIIVMIENSRFPPEWGEQAKIYQLFIDAIYEVRPKFTGELRQIADFWLDGARALMRKFEREDCNLVVSEYRKDECFGKNVDDNNESDAAFKKGDELLRKLIDNDE